MRILNGIIKRGDIFYADLGEIRGSEQRGVRPVVIIQNDTGNRYSPYVIVAVITSQINKAKLPTHIEILSGESGLNKNSVILLEQIRTIDKVRLREKIGKVSEEEIKKIDYGLSLSLNISKVATLKQKEEYENNLMKKNEIIQELQSKLEKVEKPLIITEGKTDARIIRCAWRKLYPNEDMFFECVPSGIQTNEDSRSGGSDAVRRMIQYLAPLEGKPIIGLFDNDIEGNNSFKGLNQKEFSEYNIRKYIRKHNEKDIWGMLLPVPDERKIFVTDEDISQRYFVIEHYFSDNILRTHGMYGNNILNTCVFKVNNRKDEFSKEIENLSPKEFKNFEILFSEIRKVLNK